MNYWPHLEKIHAYLKKHGWTPTTVLFEQLGLGGTFEDFNWFMSQNNGSGVNITFKPFVSTARANHQTGYECHPKFSQKWPDYCKQMGH